MYGRPACDAADARLGDVCPLLPLAFDARERAFGEVWIGLPLRLPEVVARPFCMTAAFPLECVRECAFSDPLALPEC